MLFATILSAVKLLTRAGVTTVLQKTLREQKILNVNASVSVYLGAQNDFLEGDILQIVTQHDNANAIDLTYRYAVFGVHAIDQGATK